MTPCETGEASTRMRILIVDDHHAIRRGLTQLLDDQTGLAVCAAVESAEQALAYLEDQVADLAIVDISLERMDGLQLTRQIRIDHPQLRVLILSMHDPIVYAPQAHSAGASGFVAKEKATDTLLTAIRQILAGGTYFDPGPLSPTSCCQPGA